MSTRQEVYEAIDGERTYQKKWENPDLTDSQGIHTTTEFLVFMEDYILEAKHIATREPDPVAEPKILHIVRKIAALGVACMEQNGALKRA